MTKSMGKWFAAGAGLLVAVAAQAQSGQQAGQDAGASSCLRDQRRGSRPRIGHLERDAEDYP